MADGPERIAVSMLSPKLSWLSTSLGGEHEAVLRLRLEDIKRAVGDAINVTIVSAFYDTRFLDAVASAIPARRRAKVKLRVYLNAPSGKRLRDCKRELLELQSAWRSGRGKFASALVLFVRRDGLFHTKLLVFEARRRTTIFVGSANATNAAYSTNEELMLRAESGRTPGAIEDYLAKLEKIAKLLDDTGGQRLRSLAAFFRNGTLYYKPNALAQFRFDLRLPEPTRLNLGRETLRIEGVRQRNAGYTYDPVAGLDGVGEREGGRLLLRPEAIQTCYGWWVPEAYRNVVEEKVERASSKRKAKVLKLSSAILRGLRSGKIEENARTRFMRLNTALRQRRLDPGETPLERRERFETHLSRVKAKIENPQWIDRASSDYTATVVPEIWDDPLASDAFRDSFFEYVEYANGSKKPPQVVSALRKAADFEANASSEAIRAALETYLAKNGWVDGLWQDPKRRG